MTESKVAGLAHSSKVRIVVEFTGVNTEPKSVFDGEQVAYGQILEGATEDTSPGIAVQYSGLLRWRNRLPKGAYGAGLFARLRLRRVVQRNVTTCASNHVLAARLTDIGLGRATFGAGISRFVRDDFI